MEPLGSIPPHKTTPAESGRVWYGRPVPPRPLLGLDRVFLIPDSWFISAMEGVVFESHSICSVAGKSAVCRSTPFDFGRKRGGRKTTGGRLANADAIRYFQVQARQNRFGGCSLGSDWFGWRLDGIGRSVWFVCEVWWFRMYKVVIGFVQYMSGNGKILCRIYCSCICIISFFE